MRFKYGDRVLVGGASPICGKIGRVINWDGDDILLAVEGWNLGHGAESSPWSTGNNNWWVNALFSGLEVIEENATDTKVKHWNIINKIKEIDSRRKTMGYEY